MDIENNKILKIKDWTDKAPLKLVQYTNGSWSRLTGIEFVSAFLQYFYNYVDCIYVYCMFHNAVFTKAYFPHKLLFLLKNKGIQSSFLWHAIY